MTIIRSGPLLLLTIFFRDAQQYFLEGALSEALASDPNINLVIAGIYYFFECFLNFITLESSLKKKYYQKQNTLPILIYQIDC